MYLDEIILPTIIRQFIITFKTLYQGESPVTPYIFLGFFTNIYKAGTRKLSNLKSKINLR